MGFLIQSVLASLGPQSLYQDLSPLTLYLSSSGGSMYEIKPYNQVTLLGPQNISYGLFNNYVDYNRVYVYQSYTGGSTALGCTPRSIDLEVTCGSQVSLSAVEEIPACTYHAILYTPDACGVNFAIGQELASVSSTPLPSASATPLFMITAWPTTSPVNVSATSTPLFYWTPYPSYDPNNGTSPFAFLAGTSGTTATILGAIAVGGLGIAGAAFVINHFRKGGSLKGLLSIAMANRKKISNMVKDIPIVPDSIKKGLEDPNSLLPSEAKNLVRMASNPHSAIDSLGLSPELSSAAKKLVPGTKEEIIELAQNPSKARQKLVENATNALPPSAQKLVKTIQSNKRNTQLPSPIEYDEEDNNENQDNDEDNNKSPKVVSVITNVEDLDKAPPDSNIISIDQGVLVKKPTNQIIDPKSS